MNDELDTHKLENEQDVSERVALGDFIEDNYKLIAVLGVLAALTVFSINFVPPIFGHLLSFAFIAQSILIVMELYNRIESVKNSIPLFIFSFLTLVILLQLFVYWLLGFRSIWDSALVIVIFAIVFYILMKLAERIGRSESIPNWLSRNPRIHMLMRKPQIQKVVGIVLSVALMVFTYFIASNLAPPINKFLDEQSELIGISTPEFISTVSLTSTTTSTPTPTFTPTQAPSLTPTPSATQTVTPTVQILLTVDP